MGHIVNGSPRHFNENLSLYLALALPFSVDLVNKLVYYSPMASMVNIHEAKTHLSKLLGRVESGEEIVIAKAGKPVARLVPVRKKAQRREAGSAKGRVFVSRDFLKPLPEAILAEFEK